MSTKRVHINIYKKITATAFHILIFSDQIYRNNERQSCTNCCCTKTPNHAMFNNFTPFQQKIVNSSQIISV